MNILSIFKLFKDGNGNVNFKYKNRHKVQNQSVNLRKSKIEGIRNVNNISGLSFKEASNILKKHGENSIVSHKNVSAVKIFAGQFKDFLMLILLVAAAVSIFMGEFIESVSISAILFLNAIMGFIQEYKTEKTLEALDNMLTLNVNVIREGSVTAVPANKIVRGDIILLKAGDVVPADAVILDCKKLELDESILTGESSPVIKEKSEPPSTINSLNIKDVVYMGTAVVKGSCTAKVLATGMNTQMGRIAKVIDNIADEATPLQKKLDQMGKFIVVGCLIISFIIVAFGILRGESVLDIIITGLSLAVACVPEGLPAIVTIALAFAVRHMIKRKALVRKLHAVETLGCASVICTDKTGTITQNRMTVKKIITPNYEFDVEGDGFRKDGDILINNDKASFSTYPFLKDILQTFVVCNNCEINLNEQGEFNFVGEPTEAALLVAAFKAGVTKNDKEYVILDETPFDSYKKFMTVCAANKHGNRFVFMKGAYDVVIKKCKFYKEGLEIPINSVRAALDAKHSAICKAGMRVLAFAYKCLDGGDSYFTFLGLAAMLDPPRKEAKAAVRICKSAGIKTIMITGDHKDTAKAIAKQVGIYKKGDLCVEGSYIDSINEDELKSLVKRGTVFARVSPSHKLKIVKALKSLGNVVAMTGDGVNDAPAIKEADIGVSMGVSGSDVAKQAADLVLLDDNFSTLVDAVEEGRLIYNNIRKFMRYLLSCNIGEILTSLFAILMGMPIPLLPMQILLINLVTDSLPAIALGLEPKDRDVMGSPPRDAKESIFSKGLLFNILVRGFLIAITTLTVFTIIFRTTLSIDISRTATFLTLVSLQLIHVFECKSETKSIFKINHLNNKKLLFAVGLSFFVSFCAVWVSPFNRIVKNYPLSLVNTLIVIFLTLLVPVINAIMLGVKEYLNKRDGYEETFGLPIDFY